MKLGEFPAHLLLRGDVTEKGVVLDCTGDGEGFVLVSWNVAPGVNEGQRLPADEKVKVIGQVPMR